MARVGYKFWIGWQIYPNGSGWLGEDKQRVVSVQAGLKGEHVLGSTLRGYSVFLGELGREVGLTSDLIGTVISPIWP